MWVDKIVAALSRADSANSSVYKKNGIDAKKRLADLNSALSEQLTMHKDKKFLLEHDTLQYFEALYSLTAAGTFIAGDGETHGAGTAVRAKKFIAENGPICLFTQEGLPYQRVKAILDGSDVIFQSIDVLGVRQEAESAELYTEMMYALGTDISSCLSKIN
jgi:zinc transport system substrate-binding protein